MIWVDMSLKVLDALMLQPADKHAGSLRPLALSLPRITDHPRELGSALIAPGDHRLHRPDRDPVGTTAHAPGRPDLVGQSGAGFKAVVSDPEPVERQTHLVHLLDLPRRDGAALHGAMRDRLAELPPRLRRSINWDQGTETACHLAITATLGTPVYFRDSRSPWQHGTDENTNSPLRDYFPKVTELRPYAAEHLLAVENEFNDRPAASSRTGHLPPSSRRY